MNWHSSLPFVLNGIIEDYDISNMEMHTTEMNTTLQSNFTLHLLHRVHGKMYATG